MWFIFICVCIAVSLAALMVVWIGSQIFRSIKRKEKIDDIEYEAYERAKKKIREEMEKEK